MPAYHGLGLYWDPTILLILPALLVSMIAQARVSSAYRKYSQIYTYLGQPAESVAYALLSRAGVSGVSIAAIKGTLSDNYNPKNHTLSLSSGIYGSSSIAAVAVAAHETGHAIQHAQNYTPLKIRNSLAPVVSFISNITLPLIIVGLIFGFTSLYLVAAISFGAVLVFQLATLPVEFNASRRALAMLESGGFLRSEEMDGAKRMLKAAALTYVAATLSSFLQVLRFLLLASARGRRR